MLKKNNETLLELYEYIGGFAAVQCTGQEFLALADLAGSVKAAYNSWTIPKKNGKPRVIEEPIPELKRIQRALIPLFKQFHLGEHVHGLGGFKHDAYSNAMEHIGSKVVVQMDIKDFFPSTTAEQAAWCITRLIDNGSLTLTKLMVQALCFCFVWDEKHKRYRLPMGAPTSPILANIAFSEVDMHIKQLATAYNLNYTRYMDDLTFSGGRYPPGLQKSITTLVKEHSSYKMNHKKSQVSWRGNHQQKITGVVVNTQQSVGRDFKKKLRAELDHHSMTGASNLTAYLQGKLAYMQRINPQQALKMRKYFQKRILHWQQQQF